MGTVLPAPQRLYLMQVGTSPANNNPFVCYLVQTGDGKNILIDSGLPAVVQPPPGVATPLLGKNVVEQIAVLGLRPGDIHLLVCTHFDGDHAGNHEAFLQAEWVVQRAHHTNALGNPRFATSRPHWDRPEARYRFVDGDTQLLPGLDLIETSGHALGHQSVLVRLPETGPVLLAIDAVPRQSAFTLDRQKGPRDEDEGALRASTRKLLDLVQREKVRLVIFGHDAEQWQTLKKLPEYYG